MTHRCVVAALLLAPASGCDLPGKPNPANRPRTPNQILNFEALYSTNCAGCHGASGQFGPAPPLRDPLFAAIIPKEALLQVIREGRHGTPMPAFANGGSEPLTEAQVSVLADGIKSQKWGEDVDGGASDAIGVENPPEYLLPQGEEIQRGAGDARRGAEVFARACAGCHGTNGVGADRNGSVGGAINVHAFLALISDQALRRLIITGRPDLGMPTYAEKDGRPSDFQRLSSDEINDLVALIAQWRAGENVALSGDSSAE